MLAKAEEDEKALEARSKPSTADEPSNDERKPAT
jgi:hypothetical protein